MGEFRVCTHCGYERGFHLFFNDSGDGSVALGLICPSCGQSFDLGWQTRDIPSSLKVRPGKVFGPKS